MTYPNRLTIVIGPSGSGKSTLLSRLLEHTDAELIRTITDRPQRNDNDTDTHTFVSTEELQELERIGKLLGGKAYAAFGAHYGLPVFSLEGTPKIVLLRAPFVPIAKTYVPDAAVVQIEAPVPTLLERLALRGDAERADAEQLQQETLMGRKLASYIITTNRPIDESYADLAAVWRDIHDLDT